MKVIALLGVVLVIFQVTNADVLHDIAESVTECSNEQKLDKKTVAALKNEDEVPEGNAEYAKFFHCLTTKVGTIDEDGNVVEDKLKQVLQQVWKPKLGDIPDVDAKVEHIVSAAVEKCRDTPKGGSVGQFALKMRNCLRAEFQEIASH